MKRRIMTVLLAGALGLSLAACGGSAQETAGTEAPAEDTSQSVSVSEAEDTSESTAVSEAPAASESAAASETEEDTAASSAQEETGEPVTVTDMTGRTITLDGPVDRIVALSAADCEVLYAVGAGDLLVGRGEYCDYPAEVLDVPAVQSGMETNIEQIVELEPQVLLMSTMAQTEEQVAALEEAGVHVVVSDAQDIEGVYTSIGIIGALTGRDAEAEELIGNMKDTFAEVEAKAEGSAGGTVYFEVSPLEYGLWAAGKNTFMDEIAGMVGLENAFSDVDGWGEISEEQVLERDPDYIVTISMYFGEGPTPEEEIMARPGWEGLKAVQNKAILNLRDNELSRPGPRLADGAKMLSDFVSGGALEEAA